MKGKHIVIVGGSAGIGIAIAQKACKAGAQVSIASRSAEKLKEAKASLSSTVKTYQLDISDEQQVISFFQNIVTCDHLISTIKPAHVSNKFSDGEVALHRSAFDTKFWGQYYLALHGTRNRAVTESITFTSGIAAARGYPGFASTAAINGAIESLVKSLAVELAPIRVNAVSPGFIERFPEDTQRYAMFKKLGSQVPLDRLGAHDEVAQGYFYLMQNRYTTGSVLTIDGGELCS